MKYFSDAFSNVQQKFSRCKNVVTHVAKSCTTLSTTCVQSAMNSEFMHRTARGHLFQFLEGFSSAITMPFTIIKTAGLESTRRLSKDLFTYNVLYYALPAITYAFIQDDVSALLGGPDAYLAIMVHAGVNLALIRAAINSYILNVGNNLNATSLKFHAHDTPAPQECGCKESQHIKATLLNPLHFLAKLVAAGGISFTQLSWMSDSIIKPHLYGEAVLDANTPEQCIVQKPEFFARNNATSYGIGLANFVLSKCLAMLVTTFTGVNSAYVLDAITNMNYAFMLLHINDKPPRLNFEQPLSIDWYYFPRENMNLLIKKIRQTFFPQQGQVINLRDLSKSLDDFDKHPITEMARYIVFYSELNKGLKEALLQGPFNLFVTLNKDKISPYLDQLISIANASQVTREIGKRYYHKKKHIVYILKVIEQDAYYANVLLTRAKRIIDDSNKRDLRVSRWVDQNVQNIEVIDEYDPRLEELIEELDINDVDANTDTQNASAQQTSRSAQGIQRRSTSSNQPVVAPILSREPMGHAASMQIDARNISEQDLEGFELMQTEQPRPQPGPVRRLSELRLIDEDYRPAQQQPSNRMQGF